MKNVSAKLEGSVLTLVIDLSKTQGPSKSGKSQIIATSEGNGPIAELVGNGPVAHGVYLGLNVYRK